MPRSCWAAVAYCCLLLQVCNTCETTGERFFWQSQLVVLSNVDDYFHTPHTIDHCLPIVCWICPWCHVAGGRMNMNIWRPEAKIISYGSLGRCMKLYICNEYFSDQVTPCKCRPGGSISLLAYNKVNVLCHFCQSTDTG